MSEFAAYYQTLQASSNLTLLGALLLVNSIISALVAAETIRHLPYREPRQRRLLWLLIFLCGLFVPLLGSLGAALAMLGGMRWQTAAGREPFRQLSVPEFDPFGRREGSRFDRGGLRARVVHSNVPAEQRLQSIAALQHLPPMAASPVLRTLLDDSVEDIRLVAFGMLDKEEKKIAERIHDLMQQPEPASERQRYQREKQLAELYWELAYSGLVQGDLRRYALSHALSHAEAALDIQGESAGLRFLAARILDALERNDEAERNMLLATTLGIPQQRTLPYLAEFAFERRDYRLARQLLEAMRDAPVTPRLRPVMDYWTTTEST
jgi:hypothetical protein